MKGFFLWNGWHAGDTLIAIPLVEQIMEEYDGKIALGCYRNHAYLLEDLGVEVIASEYDDSDGPGSRSPLDLSYLCPSDCVPINTWVGSYPDLIPPSWPTLVETFNRQAEEGGHPFRLRSRRVPDIHLRDVGVSMATPAIYVENSPTRSGHSLFVFDMQRLARDFPGLNFYCTGSPHYYAKNLFDCAHLNLIELASVSNRCLALVGRGSGPFICTLTEANRYKPRALMNFHDPQGMMPESQYRFWDDSRNAMEYLGTYEELADFLKKVEKLPRMILL